MTVNFLLLSIALVNVIIYVTSQSTTTLTPAFSTTSDTTTINTNQTSNNSTTTAATTVWASTQTTSYTFLVKGRCEQLKNFTFQTNPAYPKCKPCDLCFTNIEDTGFVGQLGDLMTCFEHLGAFPIPTLKDEPLLLTLFVNSLLAKMVTFGLSSICSPYYAYPTKYLFTFGHKTRYSDHNLPDYSNKMFKGKRWEGKNDTIEIPYGNIVKGDYSYVYVIYKSTFTNMTISTHKQRFKKEWNEKHPIGNGEYLDPRSEEGLFINDKLVFNSVLMSVELTPSRSFPLPGENKISFTKLDRTMVNPLCISWQKLKPAREGDKPTTGYWSNYGIRVHKDNESMTVCMASHFGLFAVVAERYIPPADPAIDPLDVLVVIFTIGSCLIIVIFILALFILKCVQNPYSRIYLYLSLSCLLAQMIFLVGLTKRDDWDGCTQVGTWIQFCHVSVITWIMIESVHQLSRIRYFFNDKTNIDVFYFVLGWGFPLAVAIALQGFPYEKFEKQRYCWIYVTGYDLWFFAGPMAIMLIITICIRIIMFMDIRKNPEKMESDINYKRAYSSLVASSAIIPTFLVLWIFGTYAIKSESSIKGVALIALPLLNLAVGAEIFYFYFYRNDEVRDALKRELNIREKQKLGTYHYLRGLNMNVAYRADSKASLESEENQTGSQIKLIDNKTKEDKATSTF